MERKSVRVVHWSFRSFVGRGVVGSYWIPGMSFLKVFHKSWSDFGNVKIVFFFHYLWLEVVTDVEVRSHCRKLQYSIEKHWIIYDQNESVHKFTQKQKLRKFKIRKNTCVFGTNSAKNKLFVSMQNHWSKNKRHIDHFEPNFWKKIWFNENGI